jgi:hypothetical protein
VRKVPELPSAKRSASVWQERLNDLGIPARSSPDPDELGAARLERLVLYMLDRKPAFEQRGRERVVAAARQQPRHDHRRNAERF